MFIPIYLRLCFNMKFLGKHSSIQEVMALIAKVAPFKTTCLITGESGTGKELVARTIHQQSKRKNKNFVTINCGAIPEQLLESELFGYVKGSFTGATTDKKGLFEEAHGGTIFLDEIGEMSLALQSKLLRVLQESEIRKVGGVAPIQIDVRVLSATLKDLSAEVAKKTFREDLYYRLNVMSLHLPALRERKEDIPELVQHFLDKYKKTEKTPQVDALVLRKFQQYQWPGNIRELENTIERAVVLSNQDDRIELEHLPENFRKKIEEHETQLPMQDENLSIKQRVMALEIELIKKALLRTSGNRTHAAKILEISHRALLYKLKEYELSDFP
ncbi:MAG: sigma 54-interacting transcriptional regulator [Deltaproteobacteria bacterium]|nr:sigma 54-interacting transcriptional regulator [Deltaproteobacteria bacterium]